MNKHIKFETNCVWVEDLRVWIVIIEIDGQIFTSHNDKLKVDEEAKALDWSLEFRKKCEVEGRTVEFEDKPSSNTKRSPLPKELN